MKSIKLSLISILSISTLTAVVSTSCHTMSGVGQDVEKVGQKIEKTSNKNRREMAN